MRFREKTDTLTFFLMSSDAHVHSHIIGVELSVLARCRTLG